LVERRVLERTAAQLLAGHGGLIRFHHLVEDASGLDGGPARARRAVYVSGDAEQALDGVEEPRLAAHREIEARGAVRDDIEPRRLLLLHDAGDGVQVLLAEARVAEGILEGAAPQHFGEPRRPRPGAGDGGGQRELARGVEHSGSSRRVGYTNSAG